MVYQPCMGHRLANQTVSLHLNLMKQGILKISLSHLDDGSRWECHHNHTGNVSSHSYIYSHWSNFFVNVTETHLEWFTNCLHLPHWQQVYLILQSLLLPKDSLERDTTQMLCVLSQEKTVVVQWISSCCGLLGNTEADRLAKSDISQPQHQYLVSCSEAKTIISTRSFGLTRTTHHPTTRCFNSHVKNKTTILRLPTGHYPLQAHLHHLGLSHTPWLYMWRKKKWHPNSRAHHLPLYKEAQTQLWSQGATLEDKTSGAQSMTSRRFICTIIIDIWGQSHGTQKKTPSVVNQVFFFF